MRMTEEQIGLVKRTWGIFRRMDPVLVGDVFYEKLFSEHPSFKRMFKGSRAEQSKKLIDMLSSIVGHLDALDELTDDIRALAIRHVHYGVRPSYYAPVGVALLWTLEQGLGVDWNADVAAAWKRCYTILSTVMIDASK